ncbi:hypothetical protein HYH03_018695 [Edaphochlamys debaryana]|uniref:Guanylate cyclase domain-containing protein n=1 Tax=Edaphochlamys debaryana TaxID=47281 RepID=A0A835XJR6_9CHLO|nr:hypothetical protein HYH03_018695 [Edaphochlamys debaryana]|eukprot:KAG2482375.1 hypothetical protein HYH03_018695 [Edaphochlamys debaryana]
MCNEKLQHDAPRGPGRPTVALLAALLLLSWSQSVAGRQETERACGISIGATNVDRLTAAAVVLSCVSSGDDAQPRPQPWPASQPLRLVASSGAPEAWALTHLGPAPSGPAGPVGPDPASGSGAAVGGNRSHSSGAGTGGASGAAWGPVSSPWPIQLTVAPGPAIRSWPIFYDYDMGGNWGPVEFDGPEHYSDSRRSARRRLQQAQAPPLQIPVLPPPPPPPHPAPPPPAPLPDAWVVSGDELGGVDMQGRGVDLTALVRSDRSIQWSGLLPGYVTSLYRMGGRAVGLPLALSTQLLYWDERRLAAEGLRPPETWQQLLEAAGRMHGKDLDGDGRPDYGLCVVARRRAAGCPPDLLPLLLDAWAAHAQASGTRQGLWFSQDGQLRPLVDSAALREALRLAVAAAALGPQAVQAAEALACDLGSRPSSPGGAGLASENATAAAGTAGVDGSAQTPLSPLENLQLAVAGRCAFAIAPGLSLLKAVTAAARAAQQSGSKSGSGAAAKTSPLYGSLGVSALPGSARIWRYANDSLVACTRDTCPFAQPMAPAALSNATPAMVPAANVTAPPPAGNGSAAAPAGAAPALPPGHGTVGDAAAEGAAAPAAAMPPQPLLVNRAQVLQVTAAAVLREGAAPERLLASYALLSAPLAKDAAMREVLDPTSDADPFRYSHLELGRWVAAGYDPSDTAAALSAYAGVLSSANLALPLAVPGAQAYISQLRATAAAYVTAAAADSTPADAEARAKQLTKGAAAALSDAYAVVPESAAANGIFYQRSLRTWTRGPEPDYQPGEAPWAPVAAEAPPRKTGGVADFVIFITAVAAGFGVIAAGAVGLDLFARHMRRRTGDWRKTRGPRMAAPQPSPDLTILITDIEGSTTLWEALPAPVMDAALRLHAQLVRGLLVHHGGYESCTEGDSFVCAFAAPVKALAFSIQLQTGLTQLAWPQPLLDHPCGCELYVVPRVPGAQSGGGAWADTGATLAPRDDKLRGGLTRTSNESQKQQQPGPPEPRASANGGGGAQASPGARAALEDEGCPPPQQQPSPGSRFVACSVGTYASGSASGEAGPAVEEAGAAGGHPSSITGASGAGGRGAGDLKHASSSGLPGPPAALGYPSCSSPGVEPGHCPGLWALGELVRDEGVWPQVLSAFDKRLGRKKGDVPKKGQRKEQGQEERQGSKDREPSSESECRAEGVDQEPALEASELCGTSWSTANGDPSEAYLRFGTGVSGASPRAHVPYPGSSPVAPLGRQTTLAASEIEANGGPTESHVRSSSGRPEESASEDAHGTGAGAGAAQPTSLRPRTFRHYVLSLYATGPSSKPGAVLVYRGLRLRLGLHCGEAGRVLMELNKASGRVIYGGPLMTTARAIANSGNGGAIVMSGRVRARLLAAGKLAAADEGVALYAGHFQLPRSDASHRAPCPGALALTIGPSAGADAGAEVGAAAESELLPSMSASAGLFDTHLPNRTGGAPSGTFSASAVLRRGTGAAPSTDSSSLAARLPASAGQADSSPLYGAPPDAAAVQQHLYAEACKYGKALYQVVGGPKAVLSIRAALEAPLSRAGHCVSPGALASPLGASVAIAEVRAHGTAVLAAWNGDVFAASMRVAAVCCRRLAERHGVVLVHEATASVRAQPGRAAGVVAVGAGPSAAPLVAWALECLAQGMHLPWPPGLLQHELAEPLTLWEATAADGPSSYPNEQAAASGTSTAGHSPVLSLGHNALTRSGQPLSRSTSSSGSALSGLLQQIGRATLRGAAKFRSGSHGATGLNLRTDSVGRRAVAVQGAGALRVNSLREALRASQVQGLPAPDRGDGEAGGDDGEIRDGGGEAAFPSLRSLPDPAATAASAEGTAAGTSTEPLSRSGGLPLRAPVVAVLHPASLVQADAYAALPCLEAAAFDAASTLHSRGGPAPPSAAVSFPSWDPPPPTSSTDEELCDVAAGLLKGGLPLLSVDETGEAGVPAFARARRSRRGGLGSQAAQPSTRPGSSSSSCNRRRSVAAGTGPVALGSGGGAAVRRRSAVVIAALERRRSVDPFRMAPDACCLHAQASKGQVGGEANAAAPSRLSTRPGGTRRGSGSGGSLGCEDRLGGGDSDGSSGPETQVGARVAPAPRAVIAPAQALATAVVEAAPAKERFQERDQETEEEQGEEEDVARSLDGSSGGSSASGEHATLACGVADKAVGSSADLWPASDGGGGSGSGSNGYRPRPPSLTVGNSFTSTASPLHRALLLQQRPPAPARSQTEGRRDHGSNQYPQNTQHHRSSGSTAAGPSPRTAPFPDHASAGVPPPGAVALPLPPIPQSLTLGPQPPSDGPSQLSGAASAPAPASGPAWGPPVMSSRGFSRWSDLPVAFEEVGVSMDGTDPAGRRSTPGGPAGAPGAGGPFAAAGVAASAAAALNLGTGRLVARGLRLKAAVHVGRVEAALAFPTGRLTYRGRPSERVAALAELARPGQVLVTNAAACSACRVGPTARVDLLVAALEQDRSAGSQDPPQPQYHSQRSHSRPPANSWTGRRVPHPSPTAAGLLPPPSTASSSAAQPALLLAPPQQQRSPIFQASPPPARGRGYFGTSLPQAPSLDLGGSGAGSLHSGGGRGSSLHPTDLPLPLGCLHLGPHEVEAETAGGGTDPGGAALAAGGAAGRAAFARYSSCGGGSLAAPSANHSAAAEHGIPFESVPSTLPRAAVRSESHAPLPTLHINIGGGGNRTASGRHVPGSVSQLPLPPPVPVAPPPQQQSQQPGSPSAYSLRLDSARVHQLEALAGELESSTLKETSPQPHPQHPNHHPQQQQPTGAASPEAWRQAPRELGSPSGPRGGSPLRASIAHLFQGFSSAAWASSSPPRRIHTGPQPRPQAPAGPPAARSGPLRSVGAATVDGQGRLLLQVGAHRAYGGHGARRSGAGGTAAARPGGVLMGPAAGVVVGSGVLRLAGVSEAEPVLVGVETGPAGMASEAGMGPAAAAVVGVVFELPPKAQADKAGRALRHVLAAKLA